MMKRLSIGLLVAGLVSVAGCGDDATGPGGAGPGSGGSGAQGGAGGQGGQGGQGGSTDGQDGSPCAGDSDCTGAFCITEPDYGWPSGACSGSCDLASGDCAGGGTCVDVGNGDGTGLCFVTCDQPSDCRDAYTCEDPGLGVSLCLPACTLDEQCTVVNSCNVTEGLCIAPETVCDNFEDDDSDGLTDCQDPTGCQPQAVCQPGNTDAGGACAASSDCKADATDPLCISEDLFGFPMGLCSEYCDPAAGSGCSSGDAACVDIGLAVGGICLDVCVTAADCRPGYECAEIGGVMACLGSCTDDAQCTGFCNADSGACSPTDEDCADAADNDSDGAIDCEDLDCAPQASCVMQIANACGMAPAAAASNMGDTTGGTRLFAGSCTGSGALERVFTFTPGVAGEVGTLTLTLQSATDQGIYVRSACDDGATELGCVDAEVGGDNGGSDEVLAIPVQGGQPLAIFVDGFLPGEEGPFSLTVDFTPAVCGDGTITAPEECDDGNTTPGDGCSDTCQVELGFYCAAATPALASNMGDTTGGTSLFQGSCTGGLGATEALYTYTPPGNGMLAIVMQSATDQGIYVRTDCVDSATELGCADVELGGTPEMLTVPVTAGVPVTIFVDGFYDPAEAGPFSLDVTYMP